MKKILMLGAVALSAGCFNMSVNLDIGADGKGKSEVKFSGLKDNDMFISGLADSLGEKADTVIREEKGDSVFYTVITEKKDFTAEPDAVLTKEGDTWTFHMVEEGSGTEDETTKSAFEGYKFTMTVKFPGKVLTHNATKASGNTLTWEMPMYDFQVKGLDAKAEYKPGGGGLALGGALGLILCIIGIVVIVVVVIIIIVVVVSKSKKKGASTTPPPAA